MFDIAALDSNQAELIQQKIDQKTKPLGALGKMEKLAFQLASIIGHEAPTIDKPTMLVFAGDHGIASEGISIAPSEVTSQMVLNFLNGGAAINCFCQTADMNIQVIDAGIANPVNDERLLIQPLGKGTQNFVHSPAMSEESLNEGIELGAQVVFNHVEKGSNVFGFGEMGIGNTSSAAALMAAVLQLPVSECVGRGTGIDDSQYQKKVALIERALETHGYFKESPLQALATYGGFEIVQMVGAMLAAAQSQSVLIIDGFISTTAALITYKINPNALDYMVFGHQSTEQGHQKLLDALNAKPLLALDLRLGEGTGAALALNLIRSAAAFYNDMASFESAGVKAV